MLCATFLLKGVVGWVLKNFRQQFLLGPPSTSLWIGGGKNLSTLIRNGNHIMIGHRHLRCQEQTHWRKAPIRISPQTRKDHQKRSASFSRFLVLLVAVKFLSCSCNLYRSRSRWRIRKARTSTYPCIYAILYIYIYIYNTAFTFE